MDGQAEAGTTHDWPSTYDKLKRDTSLGKGKQSQAGFNRLLELVNSSSAIETAQAQDIVKLLIATVPKTLDTTCRNLTLDILRALLLKQQQQQRQQNGHTPNLSASIAKWLSIESEKAVKGSTAATTRFALLSWALVLYSVLAKGRPEPEWPIAVSAIAILTDSLLDAGNHTKESLRHSSLVRTRRAIRSTRSSIPALLELLLDQKNTPAFRNATLLGITIDVALRLKDHTGQKDPKNTVVSDHKDQILAWYLDNLVASKTLPPKQAREAFIDFFAETVLANDVESVLTPAFEKAISKMPDVGMPIVQSFYERLTHRPPKALRALLPAVLTPAKSVAPSVRESALKLYSTLYSRVDDAEAQEVAKETMALLQSGKTASADHRITLLNMLSTIPQPSPVAVDVINVVLTVLTKETNENANAAAWQTVAPALRTSLQANKALSAAQLQTIAKALSDTKAKPRRNAFESIGMALWGIGSDDEAVTALAEAILPALENALKTASTSALTQPGGPVEGFITVALLLGPLSMCKSDKVKKVVEGNAVMSSLLTTGAKPSFVLWDKVHRKITASTDEIWAIRSLLRILEGSSAKVNKDENLRATLVQGLLYFAIEGSAFESRKATIDALVDLHKRDPSYISPMLNKGIRQWLDEHDKSPSPKSTVQVQEDESKSIDLIGRLRKVLDCFAVFSDNTDGPKREELLSDVMVLCHHPAFTKREEGIWTSLLQHASVDPDQLVRTRLNQLLDLLWTDASTNPPSQPFANAAYAAASTLAFIAPDAVVPKLFSQLEDDLTISHLAFMGSFEYGVWATPEGQTFVDVLAPPKPKNNAPTKNTKQREIEIWEAELREALARKKPVVTELSKQDRIKVEKQLAEEAVTRDRVANALGRLRRGFAISVALINSRAHDYIQQYLATIINDFLAVVTLRPAGLVKREAFDTWLALASVCSPRLGSIQTSVAAAVLRGVGAEVVPEEFSIEPLDVLVLRVLHRLHFLSDQKPFDAGTFAYAAPLLSRVIQANGLGVANEDREAVEEQVTLTLDVLGFHARSCSDTAFPRLSMIADVVAVLVAHPQLSRSATTVLSNIATAMGDSATRKEQDALLTGLNNEDSFVRYACLQALQALDLTEIDFAAELFVAAHDVDERNRELAATVWQENALTVPSTFAPVLIAYLAQPHASVRKATAEAISQALRAHPDQVNDTLERLIEEYRVKARELVPEFDKYGMIIEESLLAEDPWRNRVAIASTLRLSAPSYVAANVETVFNLMIEGKALADRSEAVRTEMLEASNVIIDSHGKENLQSLIAKFEDYLGKPAASTDDYTTEALIILFGRLARHLDPSDTRVKEVIERLIEALKTPSEVVQAAVCDCLPPLVKVVEKDVPIIVERLFTDLFEAEKYAERRGAAYGLAGVVMGRGMSSLREFDVLARLQDNAEDKKNVHARQGAVFGYEILATVLGRLFEPYIRDILPVLLQCFGDASTDVRVATSDAAKAIMSGLSGYAVKTILPTLLAGLDERQWRAKKGAIELMGAMAFLAPKQLSASLPTVIPRLTEVLTDTHKQVRESGNSSLKRFGEVVTNPEIKEMSSVLLEALVDPAKKTPKALDALLSVTFAHFIDSSSLALIVPILDRGLRERSADIKRKSASIVGNMATLTDSKDLIPYLGQLVPLVRSVLIDPVPEARATAAKCLGGLVERLGENNFPDLLDSLMAVLKSPSSGVDQQGAAQGVSEVLAGLGVDRLDEMLPAILASTSDSRSYVREGHISLLVFLPTTFGDRFAPYLGRIIQPILKGLADDSDFVREASMRAGRMIVANHSNRAIELMLPELEEGMFDPSWRIRWSSVQLVGDLLFRITGISGRPSDEDGDVEEEREETTFASDNTKKALIDALGRERRDRVLAALYIVRQDSTGSVRQSALQVWKALVSNSPRTVREILPVLMQLIVRALASPGADQRETAARCLADTCRRLGESVLAEVVGILQKAMSSPDRKQREGVCLAITEILLNTTRSSLEDNEGTFIAVIRGALVDSDANVRSAAAQAFDAAQQVIGTRSIDETLPTLLDALRTPGETADAALAALREVMQVRAEKIFPVLIPRLIAKPITAFNAHALAQLVKVAGSALGRRLTQIVDSLQSASQSEQDGDTLAQIDSALTAVLGSVVDHDSGLGSLQMHMLALAKHEDYKKRIVGCELFTRFCGATSADFSDYHADWIRQLVSLLDDRATEVVEAAWAALDAFTKKIDKDEMDSLVLPLRRTIESTGSVGHSVAGFSRPNGLKPLLPILLQGLLAGNAEQREQAAFAFGDLVERTAPDAFKAYCIQTVGPLIRVIGDRFPAPVKSAILSTLTIMLERVPQYVKPFFPQLQRTFVKSLTDATSLSVRTRAVSALGVLMLHQPRIDPLVTELTNVIAQDDGESSSEVRTSVVNGLAAVVKSGGQNLSEGSKSAVVDIVSEAFAESASSNRREQFDTSIARLLAAIATHDKDGSLAGSFVTNYVVSESMPPTQLSSLALRELVDQASEYLYDIRQNEAAVSAAVRNAGGSVPPSIARPARETKELMREREPFASDAEAQSKLA